MGVDREHERWAQHEAEDGYIRAHLRLLSATEGGRDTPVGSGYRSHWAFPREVHAERHDAPLILEGPRWLQPGEEATVHLHPLMPELWPAVQPGLQLAMLEGARIVGVAKVLEAIPPAV